jgi:hypothetical protein
MSKTGLGGPLPSGPKSRPSVRSSEIQDRGPDRLRTRPKTGLGTGPGPDRRIPTLIRIYSYLCPDHTYSTRHSRLPRHLQSTMASYSLQRSLSRRLLDPGYLRWHDDSTDDRSIPLAPGTYKAVLSDRVCSTTDLAVRGSVNTWSSNYCTFTPQNILLRFFSMFRMYLHFQPSSNGCVMSRT